jgi:aspartate racemase
MKGGKGPKTIGLLGGMSWESTATYYQLLNRGMQARLGGLHSAKILLHSVDFAEIEAQQRTGDWGASAEMLAGAAQGLEAAGADMILIGTNTMHKVAPEIEERIRVPLLHIADATADAARRRGFGRLALLGTPFTMEEESYKGRISDRFGMDVMVPKAQERTLVHDVIYEELCKGVIRDASREAYIRITEDLQARGADAVILGCTEIGLLLSPAHTAVPLLDTTAIHAEAAVDLALS